MNGGPYIYDPESKKFIMRPAREPQRTPLEKLPDLPDEPPLLPARIKPHAFRKRQRLIMWLVFASLFLLWLILLASWTWQVSFNPALPVLSSSSVPAEFLKEDFRK